MWMSYGMKPGRVAGVRNEGGQGMKAARDGDGEREVDGMEAVMRIGQDME